MNLEIEPQTVAEWLASSWSTWAVTLGVLSAVVLCLGLLQMGLLYGLSKGAERLVAGIIDVGSDIVCLSPRRVFALARLTVQESLRRQALAGVAIFVLILLFALWFLDAGSVDPARLYFSFVLTATTYLVLALTAVLAALSLPADIRNRTITTVVTKPVRPSEIVLGRILGLATIGTVLLAFMGASSYVFVVRALDHAHDISPDSVAKLEASPDVRGAGQRARTSTAREHYHEVVERTDGTLATNVAQGHWHPVNVDQRDGRARYVVGDPLGQFHARVPIYGQLRFKDRHGSAARKGDKVGYEWAYRSYIEGGSLASAIWTFRGIRADDFPDGLRLEMNIRVFRTYTGEVERGIAGTLVLRNPRNPSVASSPINFIAKEFTIDRHLIPRQLTDAAGKPIDLFKDLVDEGELEIQLQCVPARQFFGMAQADLYLMRREGSVAWNYIKTLAGIWLQMLMVASCGVMWSTFLNGAVALLATTGTMLIGFTHEFILRIAEKRIYGGATFESIVRILGHTGSTQPLDNSLEMQAANTIDPVVRTVMHVVAKLVPNFEGLSNVPYLVDGFDVPLDRLLIQGISGLGFVLPVFLLGVVFFKFREVAQ